uniref:Tail assembly chaperone n=2 Tax=viral metagenome TaxID=1070528 RepID=A0A6M3MFG3_9ZZZZ
MPRLTIDLEKSLYPPIEVEIDGKIFVLKKVTQKMLKKIGQLDEEIPKGNLEAAWERLEVLFGPHKIFSNLDIFQVGQIIGFVIKSIMTTDKEEKKASRPEEKKSLS